MPFSINEINSLDKSKIQVFIDNQVPEGKNLEYKEKLVIQTYEGKKEFLADVSAFANAEGGEIIYGIKEDKGIPIELCGIELNDPDAEKSKIENILRDCLEPRIPGISIVSAPLSDNKHALVIRIPKSFILPHVVKINSHWKFYSRNSSGKYSLEISELRTLFNVQESIKIKIRNFWLDRISQIKNKSLQVPLVDGPRFVIHLVPLNPNIIIDISKYKDYEIGRDTFIHLTPSYNYEGIFLHSSSEMTPSYRYIQIFRNGSIEFCNIYISRYEEKMLGENYFERILNDRISEIRTLMEYFEIESPCLLLTCILDIKGYKINAEDMFGRYPKPFFQNELVFNEVLFDENSSQNISRTLKPILDQYWNSCGFPRCPHYNAKGEWELKD